MQLRIALAAALTLLVAPSAGAQAPAGIGENWHGEFEHAARQITQLAEATPADKFAWRPAANVRSMAEVYMHIAVGNHFLIGQAGAPSGVDLTKLGGGGRNVEKALTSKDEVIRFLKESFDAVRAGYPKVDKTRKVNFFGKETTAEAMLLRLLVHSHEHMGQAIAYARMIGVTPPWSAGGQ